MKTQKKEYFLLNSYFCFYDSEVIIDILIKTCWSAKWRQKVWQQKISQALIKQTKNRLLWEPVFDTEASKSMLINCRIAIINE